MTAALPRNGTAVQHRAALPAEKVGEAIRTVRASGAWWATRAVYEILARTGVRSGEARLATWAEIDLDERVWTIASARTKTGRPQTIPITDRVAEILAEAAERAGGDPDPGALLFPSQTGKVMSDGAVSKLVRELAIGGTPHGLRASLRSWMAAEGVPHDLAEMSLGHVQSAVVSAYQRSDLLERRREVAERWSRYLGA